MVFSSEEPSSKISFNHTIYRLTLDFQLTIRAEPKFEFNVFTFVKSSRNHESKFKGLGPECMPKHQAGTFPRSH
jgi:hypothetical protein